MLNRLKQAWKRDRLGVLGIGLVLAALLVFAAPVRHTTFRLPTEPTELSSYGTSYFHDEPCTRDPGEWKCWDNLVFFSTSSEHNHLLPVAALICAGFFVLLLRRR